MQARVANTSCHTCVILVFILLKFLSAVRRIGADVPYIVTGRHTPAVRRIDKYTVAQEAEEAALLYNYRSAIPTGQAAFSRSALRLRIQLSSGLNATNDKWW